VTLLNSLLDAIVRLDGEALVMHVGEKPYVVLTSASKSTFRGPLAWGQVELSARPLTTEALLGMLAQMLSPQQRRMLDDLGAIEHEIDAPGDVGERFVVTAARGGDDVWIEVRRRLKPVEAPSQPLPAAVEDPVLIARPAEHAPIAPAAGFVPRPTVQPHGSENRAAEAKAGTAAEIELSPDLRMEAEPGFGDLIIFEEHEQAGASGEDDGETEILFEIAAPARYVQTAADRVDSDEIDGGEPAAVFEISASPDSTGSPELSAETGTSAARAGLRPAATAAAPPEAKFSALTVDAETVLAAKVAALAAEAETALAAQAAALATEAEASLATREAAIAAEAVTALAERVAALAAEAETTLAARAAALSAEAETALAAQAAVLAREAETALGTQAAALATEAEAALAAREAALSAEAAAALTTKEAALAAQAEAALTAKIAALAAQGAEALAAKETALAAKASAALAAKEAALAAQAEAALTAKIAALASEAAEALAAKEAALAAEASAALTAKEAALAAQAEAALAAKIGALAAEAAETLRARETSVAAEATAALTAKQAALASEAAAALTAKEAALASEAAAALTAREATLAAAAEALAAKEAAFAAQLEAAVASKPAASGAHAEASLAAREAALATESAALASKIAALESKIAAVDAEAQTVLAAREAALAVEAAALTGGAGSVAAESASEAAALLTAADVPPPEAVPVGIVVPHARPALKLQPPQPPPPAAAASTEASLVELLRAAAGHRASMVYAVVGTRPMMRVEGQIAPVGTHGTIAAGDVERFIFEFAPRDQVSDAAPEWTCTVPDVGRVRCVTFHDHTGAGLIFHLPAADASSADVLGLGPEVQALCAEADGLVVVAGLRSSGKSTLLNAFVDLINRTRYDHVITIESQISMVHEKRYSFISQREVRGDGHAIAAAARAALREGPDVLVIEDLRAPEALVAALDAARGGRLVFGSISAPTAPAAVERLIDAFPADRRPQVRASLSGALRAVVAQLLVPKAAGGRIAAREVLLSSPAVQKLLLDGATWQLPIAIESGRSLGMTTMVDSLGALVRDGVVEIGDACGAAPDRVALIAALERDGVDVSGVERRA
jgi:twitching motility protein PilT